VDARDVLRRLTAAGCRAEVDREGRLLVRPGYRLTDALRDLIRQERDGIVRELRRAEVEAALAAACRRLRLPWAELRAHPDGVTDADLDAFVEDWPAVSGRELLECYLSSIASRLAIRYMPAINERAA
jgi:hypothetical protein